MTDNIPPEPHDDIRAWRIECGSLIAKLSMASCFDKPRLALAMKIDEAVDRMRRPLVAAEADASELRNILLCHNFAPCDTAACNCNGWHERATGNGFYARFREIEEAVGDHNGKTLLKAVQEIVAQRDRAEADLDAERKMRVEAEAAAKRAEEERDALKAKLAALVAINKKVLLQATIRKVPPFESFFEVGWGSDEEKEWSKALRDASS